VAAGGRAVLGCRPRCCSELLTGCGSGMASALGSGLEAGPRSAELGRCAEREASVCERMREAEPGPGGRSRL